MKKILCLTLSIFLIFSAVITVFASEYDYGNKKRDSLVYDEANILSSADEKKLLKKLEEVSNDIECELAFVTADSSNGKDIDDFAENLCNEFGFGFGNTDNYIVLIILKTRDYRFASNDFGSEIMDSSESYDNINNEVLKYLKTDEYYNAGICFADACKEAIEKYDNTANGKKDFFSLKWLIVSLIIGIIIGFIYTGILKSQLKTVHSKATANDYVIPGSMQLTQQNDIFLYANLKKIPKPKSDSGSSRGTGSAGNRSSSRGFRSSGGKF